MDLLKFQPKRCSVAGAASAKFQTSCQAHHRSIGGNTGPGQGQVEAVGRHRPGSWRGRLTLELPERVRTFENGLIPLATPMSPKLTQSAGYAPGQSHTDLDTCG